MPAELGNAGLERHARAQRRLLKDHGQRLAGQSEMCLARRRLFFQVGRQIEHREDFIAREVRHGNEAAPFEA